VISGSQSRDAWPYCRDLRESMTYILCDSIDAAAAFLRITTHLLIGEAPTTSPTTTMMTTTGRFFATRR